MIVVRGPMLIPRPGGSVQFIRDGIISGNARGLIDYVGEAASLRLGLDQHVRKAQGLICPPFFDNHIHIPQHPIRGHFMDGVPANPDGGRLIAGLNRNVFPAEARCADPAYAQECVREFVRDTLAHGVVGGAAYMTVHPAAARIALESLSAFWSAGLVMMNQNCPQYLRNDERAFDRDAESLAREFGHRYIITDRFAVACGSRLRRCGVDIARRFGLRMQTHLNEQTTEKRFVEEVLYPGLSYTGVYRGDGLLDQQGTIMAHCIHMTDAEYATLAAAKAVVAHCPVSNTLLGSGIMPLDALVDRGIDYAICTDVGASPTTSLLNEMAQFLKVHAGRSRHATPSAALFRTTLAAAQMMGLADRVGNLASGRPMSFIELEYKEAQLARCDTSDDVIARVLLELPAGTLKQDESGSLHESMNALAVGGTDLEMHLQRLADDVSNSVKLLDRKVARVTIDGATAFEKRAWE